MTSSVAFGSSSAAPGTSSTVPGTDHLLYDNQLTTDIISEILAYDIVDQQAGIHIGDMNISRQTEQVMQVQQVHQEHSVPELLIQVPDQTEQTEQTEQLIQVQDQTEQTEQTEQAEQDAHAEQTEQTEQTEQAEQDAHAEQDEHVEQIGQDEPVLQVPGQVVQAEQAEQVVQVAEQIVQVHEVPEQIEPVVIAMEVPIIVSNPPVNNVFNHGQILSDEEGQVVILEAVAEATAAATGTLSVAATGSLSAAAPGSLSATAAIIIPDVIPHPGINMAQIPIQVPAIPEIPELEDIRQLSVSKQWVPEPDGFMYFSEISNSNVSENKVLKAWNNQASEVGKSILDNIMLQQIEKSFGVYVRAQTQDNSNMKEFNVSDYVSVNIDALLQVGGIIPPYVADWWKGYFKKVYDDFHNVAKSCYNMEIMFKEQLKTYAENMRTLLVVTSCNTVNAQVQSAVMQMREIIQTAKDTQKAAVVLIASRTRELAYLQQKIKGIRLTQQAASIFPEYMFKTYQTVADLLPDGDIWDVMKSASTSEIATAAWEEATSSSSWSGELLEGYIINHSNIMKIEDEMLLSDIEICALLATAAASPRICNGRNVVVLPYMTVRDAYTRNSSSLMKGSYSKSSHMNVSNSSSLMKGSYSSSLMKGSYGKSSHMNGSYSKSSHMNGSNSSSLMKGSNSSSLMKGSNSSSNSSKSSQMKGSSNSIYSSDSSNIGCSPFSPSVTAKLIVADVVLFAVNSDTYGSGIHWVLGVVEPKQSRFIMFDSMESVTDISHLQSIKEAFQVVYQKKLCMEKVALDQQYDELSCGYHVVVNGIRYIHYNNINYCSDEQSRKLTKVMARIMVGFWCEKRMPEDVNVFEQLVVRLMDTAKEQLQAKIPAAIVKELDDEADILLDTESKMETLFSWMISQLKASQLGTGAAGEPIATGSEPMATDSEPVMSDSEPMATGSDQLTVVPTPSVAAQPLRRKR